MTWIADDADDLEADDGISDGPLVRLVNALIFQAAEENASDVHFEAQEDALAVRRLVRQARLVGRPLAEGELQDAQVRVAHGPVEA